MEFIDNGLRVVGIDGSTRHFIREDGMKITKKKNNLLTYRSGTKHSRTGYMYVGNGKKQEAVHRLVARHFIPNPDNFPIVDHIDNDSVNNHVSNLRWCTYQQNSQYYHNEQKVNTSVKDCNLNHLLDKANTELNVLRDKVITTTALNDKLLQAIKDITLGNDISSEVVTFLKIGNTIIVDGKVYGGTSSAATYITNKEKIIGNIRSKETINKELKKVVNGSRSRGVMYDKYTIGY